MTFVTVYSLAQDQIRTEAMQKASLGAAYVGPSPLPALIGTSEWWHATEDGLDVPQAWRDRGDVRPRESRFRAAGGC